MKKYVLFLLVLFTFQCFSLEKFYSDPGKCEIEFPTKPNHIKQVVPVKDTDGVLSYDVYLSFDENESVCMMMIATFPQKISKNQEKESLESFLNGVLNYKNDKKLIYSNFANFNKLQSLDFLIESPDRLFKGKVFIENEKLYLLSIEYNSKLDLDKTYENYIRSFKFRH